MTWVAFRRVRLASRIVRALGLKWVIFRTIYAFRLRSGSLRRRLPALVWNHRALRDLCNDPGLAKPECYLPYRRHRAPRFFFSPADRTSNGEALCSWDSEFRTPRMQADAMLRGEYRYFSHDSLPLGQPPDWHLNPFTWQRIPANQHWSEIDDFAAGDIKAIWEASRFGCTYALVRAYWRNGDDSYAEHFWQLIEGWSAANPPQQGPNWKCGQETSLRVMAWCFGLYGFLDSPATTSGRVAMLAQMIAISGERIEATLSYALSQRNNHGISEGMGLWTIGALFPEFRASNHWRERGRRVLEEQGLELIYEDGSFSQHSVNYHRLMLHDYLWVLRLGDLHGTPFSPELRERVRRAGDWLYQIQDVDTGRVPYYGQNDGALILPLDNCDYQDFRPVVGAIYYLTNGRRRYGDGPWNEDLFWLFGLEATRESVDVLTRTDWQAAVGGYQTLRSSTGLAFIRAGSFRDRPGQADLLHLDLWWRGQNMALDAGTYSYNAPAPWDNALAHTAYHNTVTVDGQSQMDQVGKFLWLPWIHGRTSAYLVSPTGQLAYWEGTHDGYKQLASAVTYRRGVVRLGREHWFVLDELVSRGEHEYRLHWLLPDLPYQSAIPDDSAADAVIGAVSLTTPLGDYGVQVHCRDNVGRFSLVRACEESPRGWRAPYYLHREPALSLAVSCKASAMRFCTLLGPAGATLRQDDRRVLVQGPDWEARVTLETGGQGPLCTEIELINATPDRLSIPR